MPITSSGLATSFITFSRPGATGGGATVTDRDGKIKWAGHNLLSASEQFDATYWTKTGSTISANTAVAPNGTTTADKLAEDNTNNAHRVDRQSVIDDSAPVSTLAVFAKAVERQYVNLSMEWSTNYVAATFDLSAGTVTSNRTGGTGAQQSATITSVGSGWYLCTLTGTIGTGGSDASAINVSNTGTPTGAQPSYLGTTGNGILIWGAHLYRSDLGGMQANPAMPAGMGSYYPTTPRNLLGATEAFSDTSVWGYTGLSAFGSGSVANAAVAPNGLQTADLLTAAAGTNSHSVQQQKTTVANTEVTYSVYAKYSTAQYIAFGFVSGSTGTAWAFATVDIQSGTVTQTTVGAGASTTATAAITPVGNGWHRISVKVKSNTSDTYAIAHIVNSATPSFGSFGAYSWTAAGTESVYLWGAQLSDSASLDTYVPQYGAAVTSAAYYAPRLDFDGATLAAKGLLVEEARTNLFQHSSAFDNAYWEKLNATVTNTTAVAAPDGTQTADALTSTNSSVCIVYKTVGSAAVHTVSVYAKAASASSGELKLYFAYSPETNATFNLQTGAISSAGGYNYISSSITPVGNGWYRCSLTATLIAATLTGISQVGHAGAGETIYIWGAQHEAGAFATSYIPTGGASATRGADVASVGVSQFPYNASEGALVAEGVRMTTSKGAVIAELGDGSLSNIFELYGGGSPQGQLYVSSGGAEQASIAVSNIFPENSVGKIGGVYKANDFQMAGNGTLGTPDTAGSVPANVSTLYLGRYGGANNNQWNGWIRRITYLPRRISNAELQARTAA